LILILSRLLLILKGVGVWRGLEAEAPLGPPGVRQKSPVAAVWAGEFYRE
jgi:hypothetical protein